jgi:Antibiotic biosynthesis monooxygenase
VPPAGWARGWLEPAKYDEMARIVPDLAAAIRRLPGCQGFQPGGDRTAGRIIAVSTWDTEAHAQWARDALGEVQCRVEATGVRLDPSEIYEAFL